LPILKDRCPLPKPIKRTNTDQCFEDVLLSTSSTTGLFQEVVHTLLRLMSKDLFHSCCSYTSNVLNSIPNTLVCQCEVSSRLVYIWRKDWNFLSSCFPDVPIDPLRVCLHQSCQILSRILMLKHHTPSCNQSISCSVTEVERIGTSIFNLVPNC